MLVANTLQGQVADGALPHKKQRGHSSYLVDISNMETCSLHGRYTSYM